MYHVVVSRESASTDAFRAIADPTRRAVLDLLRIRERPVRELAQAFRMTQPALSQHLRVLRDTGLVAQRRAGRERLYRLRPEGLEPIAEWAMQYERFWRGKLKALGDLLEQES
jgi:DNA-binding transcriptional ArsR family regulator